MGFFFLEISYIDQKVQYIKNEDYLHSPADTVSSGQKIVWADDDGATSMSAIVAEGCLPWPLGDVGITASYHTHLLVKTKGKECCIRKVTQGQILTMSIVISLLLAYILKLMLFFLMMQRKKGYSRFPISKISLNICF